MSPCPGGAGAHPCGICGEAVHLPAPCALCHPDHCHSCYQMSLSGNTLENPTHTPPRDSLAPLTMRDLAAVAAYMRHVVAVTGAGPLGDLGTEEDAP